MDKRNERVSIENVISRVYSTCLKIKPPNQSLQKLSSVPCIPVSAEKKSSFYSEANRPVLVQPLQVVRHIPDDSVILFPYLCKLPPFMNSIVFHEQCSS